MTPPRRVCGAFLLHSNEFTRSLMRKTDVCQGSLFFFLLSEEGGAGWGDVLLSSHFERLSCAESAPAAGGGADRKHRDKEG